MISSGQEYKKESSIEFVNGLQSLWQGIIETSEEIIHLHYFETEEECRNALNDFLKDFKPRGRFQKGTIIHSIYERFGSLDKRLKFETRYYVYKKRKVEGEN